MLIFLLFIDQFKPDDAMGFCSVHIGELVDEKAVEAWLPLVPQEYEHVSGFFPYLFFSSFLFIIIISFFF